VSGSGTEQPPEEQPEGESSRHGLAELIAERRAKAERLRESDPDAFPYSFPDSEPIADVLAAYAHLESGEETDEVHRVAGRIAARREAGKMAFLDVVDRTGKIQLHARIDVLGEEAFERLTSLDVGDIVGVDGAALRSRRGEISLRVQGFQILAKALRPPPDKHASKPLLDRYRKRIGSQAIEVVRSYASCDQTLAAAPARSSRSSANRLHQGARQRGLSPSAGRAMCRRLP